MTSANTIPDGWVITPFGEIVEILDSCRIPLNATEREQRKGSYPYYGANGQVDTINDYLFDGDYILIAEDGGYFDDHNREVAYRVTGKFWVNNHAHIVNSLGGIANHFLLYALNRINWMPYVSGTTRLKLTQGNLVKVPILLPPLNEQRRIVAKIEALKARSQRVKEELEAIPALLDQFRQSVLAAAFRGDLTADLREKKPDVEPASVLLERIRSDHRQVAKTVCAEALDKTDLPALPNGWLWVSLEEIAIHKSGVAFKSTDFTNKGVQVVRLGNVYKGQLDLTRDPVYLPEGLVLGNFILKPGDIIVSQTGTRFKRDYGHFVVIPEGSPNLLLNQRLLVVFCHPLVPPDYVMFASKLKVYQKHFFSHETGGVNQGNVGVSGVMKGFIPLSSLAEAKILLTRLNLAVEYIDRVTEAVNTIKNELDSINQSILAKAFRGELVPQDPNDEPASVLLERIRAERAQLQAEAKGAKKSSGAAGVRDRKKVKQEDMEAIQLELPGLGQG